MKKSAKKIADPDCNQNQREVVSETQTLNTKYFITNFLKMQGFSLPVLEMAEESAEIWNAKVARAKTERERLNERWAAV